MKTLKNLKRWEEKKNTQNKTKQKKQAVFSVHTPTYALNGKKDILFFSASAVEKETFSPHVMANNRGFRPLLSFLHATLLPYR